MIRSFITAALPLVVLLQLACGANPNSSSADDRLNRPLATPKIERDRPKIVAFGDSLTAGFGLTEKESYPFLLQQMLERDGFDYEVINAGVSGDTSLGGLERVDWVLGAQNVRIMVLELGANDLLRGGSPAKMKENLETIIKKAEEKEVRVLLCGMFAPPTMGADYQREFNAVFPDLAAKYKLAYLPFLLENVALKKELNQADGIHPNVEGEKIMTANIYAALKPLLDPPR
ncbi:MAG: arylesterase [Acidobacteria bacterium]|nr:arylesterase [Acidobacteriota bacterium]